MSEITDEMVDTAARAIQNSYDGPNWDDLGDGRKRGLRLEARAALEAAAPMIWAAERERCAKVAAHLNGWGVTRAPELAHHIAATIRAFTSATVAEAQDATRAIERIVKDASPRPEPDHDPTNPFAPRERPKPSIRLMTDAERRAAGMNPNGGFDGPTGAD